MIETTDLSRLLVEHLPQHLARQRWAGALDRPIESVDVKWLEVPRAEESMLAWTLVTAHFADGGEQDYQLFLGIRPAVPPPDFLHGKERQMVTSVADDADGLVIYDALVDPDLAIAVLHMVAPDLHVEVRRPLVLEHSNSSIVFDESSILKIFRKVEPGPNPDVQITRVLAEQGYPNVLAPLAELTRDGTDLAVLRDFLVGSTEGWELAHGSLRDLLAGGLPPEESGADFAPDAERLGRALAGLHLAMAEAWGSEPGDTKRWSSEMEANLAQVLGSSGAADPGFDVDAVRERFRAVADLRDAGTDIRIHGDLHLAQVIKSDAGWQILDFEGEPARRRDDRFTVSSPLRDVAGMLRSLHYAAATGLADWCAGDEPKQELCELVDQWEQRNRDALLTCYYATPGIEALLPSDDDGRAAVLCAFELDKAVYEVGYELGHRPDHVHIPLAGVNRLISGEADA
jgi:maltokinase